MKGHKASAAIAILVFILLSMANGMIFRGQSLLYRLESRNEAEQTLNALFTSQKVYDDFGSAIEQNATLKDRVLGLGLYDVQGKGLYSWGEVPATYSVTGLPALDEGNQVRLYSENEKNRSLVLILRPTRMIPPPHPREGFPVYTDAAAAAAAYEADKNFAKPRSLMLELLRDSDVVFLELRQPELWRKTYLMRFLFPVVEIILAGLVFFIRLLVVRNREFLDRLEKQKSLVVLGTAASTLAHEIKNPLLAIRLQTSILEKTLPEASKMEVGIINTEVERLSRLTTRVNDYLRDPKGFPSLLDPAEIASEAGLRLCGRSLVESETSKARILIDSERYRSILENLLRNAIESGGNPEEIHIVIETMNGKVNIEVLDRGKGIAPADKARVFDPFFTTKSQGTGIGLAICVRFAKEVGGTISLERREGGGTCAMLTLPEAVA
ncbi:MAG TPA: HAMP domain-containing sensor histidine kinase [Rectinemataceae bacterium]|nr:HAMP domain-containing sensor histidine kinase [Rectinemataceae bacterium]